jgi:O-antigen/teichoic acid export membrane protein
MYGAGHIFFGSFFAARDGLGTEVQNSIWLFALCIPVIMYTGVAAGALIGVERFGVVSLGTTAGSLLAQVLPLGFAVVFHSTDFAWLLGASLLGRLIGLAPIFAQMVTVFLLNHPVRGSRQQMRHLFSFGSWIMVTSIVGPLMTTADRLIIGSVLGAAAVVAYSVPTQVAARTSLFPTAIVQALFPRLAATPDLESREIGKSAVVIVGHFYALLVLGLICLCAPLLTLWLGDKLDQRSILVGQIAMIGFWTNALANIPYALIQARGNSRYTALLHVAELPFYFAALYVFGFYFGLYGVALAFSLRATVDCVILFLKAGFQDRDILLRLTAPTLIIAVAMAAAPWMRDWPSGLAGATALCSALLCFTWFQMPDQPREWLALRLKR